jgi:hypothetical protein
MLPFRRSSFSLALLAYLVGQAAPAIAGTYAALCDGRRRCNVSFSEGQLITPSLNLTRERILSWQQGGKGTQTDIGMGVAGTVLFGLPGLILFNTKTHDYQYLIQHFDDRGRVRVSSIGFRNNVPANLFLAELMGFTGLSAGESNKSAQELLAKLRLAQQQSEKPAVATTCSPRLQPWNCSYSRYREANPSVDAWAKANPQLIQAEKERLGATD